MIRFALACDQGHRFEGWFRSSEDYDGQAARGLLRCPSCDSRAVDKALMAPAVRAEQAGRPMVMPDPNDPAFRRAVRAFREHVVANTEDVGDRFPEEARRIHFDEGEHRSIRGRATPEEARALREDGVGIAPLPALPEDHN